MIRRQVLSNRLSFTIHKEETVAVFVDLHVVAGTNPSAVFGLCDAIGVESAGAQRATQLVEISG
jgi:hypothetical protein